MRDKTYGEASVETDEKTQKSFIVMKLGPFKDRRAALRKLSTLMEQTSTENL